jgi:hypothetical protein
MHFDLAMDAYFAWRPRADMGIAAAIGKFDAHRSIHREGSIERSFGAGLRPTSGEEESRAGCQ